MTDTKVCKDCKLKKPLDQFHKQKDKQQFYCKSCQRKRMNAKNAVKGRIYRGQLLKEKQCERVTVEYTKEELYQWLDENGFNELYQQWVDSDYHNNYYPSVDRIDSSKGYNFDNIQLIQFKYNRIKISIDNWLLVKSNNSSGISGITKIGKKYRVGHRFKTNLEYKFFDNMIDAVEWKKEKVKEVADYLTSKGVKHAL